MENIRKETINTLLTLPQNLNLRRQTEAKNQKRTRRAQIIFILERFFEAENRRKEAKN